MAATDKKISELTAAASLTEADILPVVNSSTTKSVTLAVLRTAIFGGSAGSLTLAQTAHTGNALSVSRDLASASTDSPLVNFVNDNIGDDQVALYVRNDATTNATVKIQRDTVVVAQGVGQDPRAALYITDDNANTEVETVHIRSFSTKGSVVYVYLGADKEDGDGTNVGLRLYTNVAQTGPNSGYLLSAAQDSATSQMGCASFSDASSPVTPRGAVRITTTAEQRGLYVWSQADTNGVAGIYIDVHGKGNALYATRNESDADTYLAILLDDHATSSGGILALRQDGTGIVLNLDQNGNNTVVNIDNVGSGNDIAAPSFTLKNGTIAITKANTSNARCVEITQNDTTNNPDAMQIVTTATAHGLAIWQNGVAAGGYHALHVRSNSIQINDALVCFIQDHASTTKEVLVLQQDGTGRAFFVDQNANGIAVDIDKDCTVDNTRTWAVQITSDNAGAGTALGCGIDFSGFSAAEPVFKFVADAGGVGAAAGRVAVDIGGVTKYILLNEAA